MLKNQILFFSVLLFALSACGQIFAQTSNQPGDAVTTILIGGDDGVSRPVGSGIVVRSDGYVLTAYHLIKNAASIQIRLHTGEIYDKAGISALDERRDVALLHINAANLRAIPSGTTEESQVGTRIFIVANANGQTLTNQEKVLNSVRLADSIAGAGKGFRVLQFDALDNSAGALVLDESGHSLGIITTNPEVNNQSIAVPLSSIAGLIRAANMPVSSFPVNSIAQISSSPVPHETPYPILQSSVLMPERGVTALAPRGPGSVVIKPATPKDILAASKTIYVTSESVFFKGQHLVNALNKQPQFSDWGLSFVEDRDLADLILEIDHVVFTYKFTFKLYSQRLGTIIATGDTIIFDGNLGAPYMAKRVIQKLEKVRAAADQKTSEKEAKDQKTGKTSK